MAARATTFHGCLEESKPPDSACFVEHLGIWQAAAHAQLAIVGMRAFFPEFRGGGVGWSVGFLA